MNFLFHSVAIRLALLLFHESRIGALLLVSVASMVELDSSQILL